MNGKIQGIIICVVVLACLGGVLVFLQKTGKENSSSVTDSSSSVINSDSEKKATKLIDSSSDKISKITIENKYGTFNMVKPASGKLVWLIEELEGVNQSTDLESGMAENVAQFESYKTVEENAEDLSKFGLDKPTGKFTVTFSDETHKTFLIGDVSTQTRYTYVCEEGSNTVYMMLNSKVSYFIEPKENFVNTSLIANAADDLEYGKLTITRSDLDYDMIFEKDPYDKEGMVSAQVMTEPIFSYLNVSGSSATTHGLWGLSAEKAVMIFPKEKDFMEYGLDKPLAVVTLKGKEYDYTLLIGNGIKVKTADDEETSEIGSYYCYLKGVDGAYCIWEISASKLPWATVTPNDVITSLMTTNNIIDVSKVVIKSDEKDITYVIDSDGKNNINSVTMNGKDLDVQQFKGLYQYLLTCPTNEIHFNEPTGKNYMTIEIICADGHSDKMEFYTDSSRRSVVVLNGRPSFRIQSKWVDQLFKNIDNVENGKEAVSNY